MKGKKVRYSYTPNSGHGQKVNGMFTVVSIGNEINTTHTGRKYRWIQFEELSGVYPFFENFWYQLT